MTYTSSSPKSIPRENLEDKHPFILNLFFCFFCPFICRRTPIRTHDIPSISENDKTLLRYSVFEKRWTPIVESFMNSHPKPKKLPPLFRTLIRSSMSLTMVAGVISVFLSPVFNMMIPWLSKLALTASTQKLADPTVPIPLVPCILMFVFPTLQQLLESFGYRHMFHLASQVRSTVAFALYSKLFKLNIGAGSALDTGKLQTLLTSDCAMIGDQFQLIAQALTFPVVFTGPLVFLLVSWGWVALIALGVWLVFIPFQLWLAKGITHQSKNYLAVNDRRNKMQSEVLQGIRTVKVSGMEEIFFKKLMAIREEQVGHVSRYIFLVQASHGMFRTLPQLINLATMTTLVVVGKVSQKDFARDVQSYTGYLFQMTSPASWLPNVVQGLALMRVSMKRIGSFLAIGEIREEEREECENDENAVEIAEGEFAWPAAPVVMERKEEIKRRKKAAAKKAKEDAKMEKKRKSQESHKTPKELSPIAKQDTETPKIPPSNPAPSPNSSNTTSSVANKTVLWNLNLTIPKHKLTMVVGEVGSGKSSLGGILTKEIVKTKGTVRQTGQVVFCPQSAWIMNGTVRENILMGREMDEREYEETLRVCSLQKDLKTFAAGDETAIGEKGVNMSGGQKARIQLARAVYKCSDMIVLDDPLSAVDAEVGRFVMNECICGALKGKTVVLMTNEKAILKRADVVVVMKEGRVAGRGSYWELREGGLLEGVEMEEEKEEMEKGETAGEMKTEREDETRPQPDQRGEEEEKQPELPTDDEKTVNSNPPPNTSQHLPTINTPPSLSKQAESKTAKQIVSTEEHITGAVPFAVYWYYLRNALHPILLPLFFVMLLSVSFIITFSQYWVGVIGSSSSWGWLTYSDKFFAWGVQTVIMIVVAVFRALMGLHAGRRGPHNIHAKLLHSILSAPTAFFDTTPLGRIVSRLTSDLALMDQFLYPFLVFTLIVVMNLVGQTAIVMIDTPIFGAVGGTALVLFGVLLVVYIRAARELQRIELISRSPVVAHFSETLFGSGLSTIRAFQQEDEWKQRFASKLDAWGARFVLFKTGSKWASLMSAFVSSFFFAGVSFIGWYAMEPSVYSVAITAAMNFAFMSNNVVLNSVDLEARMASLQRIKFYTQNIPQEKSRVESEGIRPNTAHSTQTVPSDWPANGSVIFENVSFRYRPGLPLVLRNVSFEIEGGQKIGVCGRTGAGKSSLIFVLFRLVELNPKLEPLHLDSQTGLPVEPDSSAVEANGGRVVVDGVDLSEVDLLRVRKSFAIIPQDPTLFTGTIRSNMDMGGEKTDERIWEVLEMVEMKDVVSGLEGGLDWEVREGGRNLSTGQRQLLCFGRAILNERKVIVMDEATASVDGETDGKIQRTIREHCKDKTVIVIAHRLNTIMDSDRILVMDNGTVAEFDTPATLKANPDSALNALLHSHQ
ncbi:Multidrug resistance-associated protein [Blattamonas nauphoetae]|uniref:Multidrug resistance-associated protein n=1 Tax=Blattamonas nauphoetae TaxID=2049346 RepID=A0ABQ9XP63_9EUKA|nr:Multidrug resistance-associated protein [Blattamonas nauphoetae]